MSTILFMIHTIVQIVSRLLCNNALFFQRCPSHPMALCDLRQRAKAPQRRVQLWLEEGQVVRILIWIGNDWMTFWYDVSPPVLVFPQETGAGDTSPPTTFLLRHVKILKSEGMNTQKF